jgi:hypothetical protein
MALVWPAMTSYGRERCARVLPSLLHAFLDVDRRSAKSAMARYPQVFTDPSDAVRRMTELPSVRAHHLEAAAPSLRLFKRVGVFNEPGAVEAFASTGFAVLTP